VSLTECSPNTAEDTHWQTTSEAYWR